MATALAYASHAVPLTSEVSTTLTVGANAAYEVFADAVEIPRWLPIVQTARILARDSTGRPERVAFTRKLERGSLGYTLEYRYDPVTLTVLWATPPSSNVVLTGEARFVPLSHRACLMLYRLDDRSPDRRRPDPARARQAPRLARRRGVPRAPAPALLSAPTSPAPTASLTIAPARPTIPREAVYDAPVSSDRRPDGRLPSPARLAAEDAAHPGDDAALAIGTHPHPAVETDDAAAALRELEEKLNRCLATIDDALPADRPRAHARALRLRGAAPHGRSRPAPPRRDPRRRRAPRARRRCSAAPSARNVAKVIAAAPAERGLVFVNLHLLDLFDKQLTSRVRAAVEGRVARLSSRSPSARSLEGELDLRYRVAELRELGFRIAIDDLGGGHARMGTFSPLDTDFVKLDMSLVRDIEKHPMKQRLVRSITELCREQGTQVIGEGVETEAEAKVARRPRLRPAPGLPDRAARAAVRRRAVARARGGRRRYSRSNA